MKKEIIKFEGDVKGNEIEMSVMSFEGKDEKEKGD